MAYIGRDVNYGNASTDHFTGSGGATYALTYDTSTNGVVVSLDGVVQKNGTDFNITGTSLVFTSVVASPIAIQVIYTGLTLGIGTPADGTVTDAKITAMAASKLTGTIADARFPATLPAASGVNLTALNATNIGSGTVPTARLGSGTASSSTFLRGDQTYAEAGGGKVLQVVSTAKTDIYSSTSPSTFVNITGFTVAITPAATSSKILITVSVGYATTTANNSYFRLVRGTTAIAIGDARGSRKRTWFQLERTSQSYGYYVCSLTFLDSPSSTSEETYALQIGGTGDSSQIYVNRAHSDPDSSELSTGCSTITAMEIGV